jgi:hypothetical protein
MGMPKKEKKEEFQNGEDDDDPFPSSFLRRPYDDTKRPRELPAPLPRMAFLQILRIALLPCLSFFLSDSSGLSFDSRLRSGSPCSVLLREANPSPHVEIAMVELLERRIRYF